MAGKSKALKVGDSVRIFKSLYATGDVSPKWAFQQNYDASNRQQQERNGVPVWTVHCVSLGYGDLSVTVPAAIEPKLLPETLINLSGLEIGRAHV